ncbi:MAG: hypothetical protein GIX03_05300 [Candidatus Eremiobacteraeota bacterium]|nr:hypothetical protein [Candidatus Eremiobacteraeota bacterium]MBC5802414.1 hypothetical protein [Candidatus Eremiobacteraeota bacterium]MBC5820632.1 hypothetical protein [Candidatus Eremiobacteraeota bacterium]
MQTQDVTISVAGGAMPGFVARPDGAEPRPAVIGHAFFRESSAALNGHEVGDAWAKVRLFLSRTLGT